MMRRFCCYIEKVFDFSHQIHSLRDARKRPRIPTLTILGSVFFLFVMRHRSLNAMEQEIRQLKRVESVIGKIKPSADRMGDVMGLMEPDQLRAMLSRINHPLGRNKALRNDWPLRVAVFDGYEFFSQSSALLSPVLSTDGDGEGQRGDRVLSSRGGLSFSGIPHRHASGGGDDSPGKGRADCSQTTVRTSPSSLWTILLTLSLTICPFHLSDFRSLTIPTGPSYGIPGWQRFFLTFLYRLYNILLNYFYYHF